MSFITANTFSRSKIQSHQIHSIVEKSNNDAATAYNTKISSNDKKECIFGLNFFVNMPVKNSNCMFKSMPHLLSYDEWWDEPVFERRENFFGEKQPTTTIFVRTPNHGFVIHVCTH